MPLVRSAGGRAPPRANSISGCSAARPLPLLSRRAPPRPALSGPRPGHAPAWALPLGSPCRMVLSPSIKDVLPGDAGGRHSVLPIKLAPLGWGLARSSPYVTVPRTSCQSKQLQSLGRLGRKQTGTWPPLDVACVSHHGYPPRGLCCSHCSQSLVVIAGSSWLRKAPTGIQAWTLSHWLEREVCSSLVGVMEFINKLA